MRELSVFTFLAFLVCSTCSVADDLDPGAKMLQEVKARVNTISTKDLKKMIDEKQDFILLDVRNPGDVASMGVIDAPQQLEIERAWIETKIFNHVDYKKKGALEKTVVTYCGGGVLSAYAADTLQKLGFKNVYNYQDGFLEWEAKGLPVKYKDTKK